MGRFFNEIMKGKKFIPAHMELLRQEFRNRPVVPVEPTIEPEVSVAVAEPVKKWMNMNQKERKEYQRMKSEQTSSR